MIKIKLFSIVILLVGFFMLLGLTSPNNASPLMYVLMFLIIYLFSLLVISVVLDVAYSKLTSKMRFFIASVSAFTPTIIVALSSLSTISIIDVVFAVAIPSLIVWYGIKNNTIK